MSEQKNALRNWEFKIALDRSISRPLNVQIGRQIIEKIRAGLLRPGTPLPGSRELAASLSINRKTVVTVYDELSAQGWLTTEGRRGTFVSSKLPHTDVHGNSEPARRLVRSTLPHPAYHAYGSDKPLPASAAEGVIDFTDGAPDTRLVPFGALSRAFRHALIESARGNQLGYADARGLPALRLSLASMLRIERGLNADESSICIVRGSQMGIYLAARILVRPGDSVAFETLTYPPAREAFRACGAAIVSIEQDEFGMVPTSLVAACQQHHIKAIYLTPHHQYPTTVTMPLERRMQLLKLADELGFVIVEDDYDHEFHFARNPMQPLASVDRRGKVIYVGSLSKILAPGLRIGYVVAPPSIVQRIANEIVLIDRQGNSVTERAVADLLQSGELRRHIRHAAQVYQGRCNAAVKAVSDTLGEHASLRVPIGGLALWITLRKTVDMQLLEDNARDARVKILSGSTFADHRHSVHGLRLGFASLNEREFKSGIERLNNALCHQLL
ncbi:PLP-dependent aminotransferase family protein [Paraburkholderia sp. GAS42]|uniref:MocR-like pyridoxine biosynthesis transcription factor PdxR n=1 Tax=Paraburkholderia sp. GAS42 TaxID=3035135 RepID=UPI003D1BDB67